MSDGWLDIAAIFDDFGCATYRLSIKGQLLRFSARGRKDMGHRNYYRRIDDPQERRWSNETAAMKAKV